MDDPNLHAYGEDCPDDAEIGRQWRENSSLAKWFPITAERLAALEAENAALKQQVSWISVRSRRPQEDKQVLAWTTDKNVELATYWGPGEGWSNEAGSTIKVTHWTPIPDPPVTL